ncbi:MAG: flavodoxin family protein [Acholeplasmatales bacterium]|nr:flavodoxin family protein [Acholeplasmatales bacterium]
MELTIRYFTKSKKGNTLKLANFISNKINKEALDITNDLKEEAELLILVNAMYAFDIDNNVKDFLRRNKDKIKALVNVSSSASGKSTYNSVKKVCDELGIKMLEEEYHTVASWIFINKNRPNQDDFNRLDKFIDLLQNK